MYLNKHIAFICDGFPIISETFITNQILNAANNSFSVSIHVDHVNTIKDSSLKEEVNKFNLIEKTNVNISVEKSFFRRLKLSIAVACSSGELASLIKSIYNSKLGFRSLNLRDFCSFSSLTELPKPDIVHAHFGPNGVKAINAKLCGLINCPVITSFHGYDAHSKKENLEYLKKRYSTLFDVGDVFIVNSNFLRKQIENIGCPSDKIVVIPIGVDVDLFNPKPVAFPDFSDEIRLVTTGRLIKYKNQRLGIELVEKLRRKGVNASYTVIGSGPEEENLKSLAASLDVENNIIFLGSMSQNAIAVELKRHHIFLMSSDEDDKGRTETQGIVTAEAQACGLPVITLGMGGTGETIINGETGFNVLSKDKLDILDAISHIMDESQYHIFSKNARNFAEKKYNLINTNEKLLSVYRSLLVGADFK